MKISEAAAKMIARCAGSQHDIGHFLKVWAYARTIGEQEGLDERTLRTLEFAAIVHDIACPDLRKRYGSSLWNLQEEFGAQMARDFYRDSGMDGAMLDRICYLVGHHHTFTGVDGADYRILLEADFLVNAGEQEKYRKAINEYRKNVFRTKTGIALLETVFPDGKDPE